MSAGDITIETQNHADPEFRMILNTDIRPYEHQPRRYFDPQTIEELAVSMLESGQITPVLVTKRPHEHFHVLIGGERRWRACNILSKESAKPIPMKAIFEPYVDEEWLFQRAFVDNLHREDMAPLDIAAGFERLRSAGIAVESIVKIYGKSKTVIYNYLGLNGLDERVKSLMHPSRPKDNRLGIAQAVEISKVSDPELQFQIADEAVYSRVTPSDLRNLIVQQADEAGVILRAPIRAPAKARPANQDYEVLKAFFRSTEGWLDRQTERLDFINMYSHGPDREDVVMADTDTVNRILQKLRKLKMEIGKSL